MGPRIFSRTPNVNFVDFKMKYINLFLYNWKAVTQHSQSELIIYVRLIETIMCLFALVCLFVCGFFLEQFSAYFIISKNDYLGIFPYMLIPLLGVDLIIKFFVRKENQFPPSMRRFPNSEKKILAYLMIKEIFCGWNFYLSIFFFHYITRYVQPIYGVTMSVCSFLIIYISQLFITQLVFYINRSCHRFTYIVAYIVLFSTILFTLYRIGFPYVNPILLYSILPVLVFITLLLTSRNYSLSKYLDCNAVRNDSMGLWEIKSFHQNNIVNYILFSMKMITRSLPLRKVLTSYIVLTIFYLYLYYKLSNQIENSFVLNIIFIFVISAFFPLAFNQYLFSAEATFFDHFMIIPRFKNILTAKYIMCMFMSLMPISVLFILTPFTFNSIIILIAAWVYSLGTITLSSFSSLLAADIKLELSTSNIVNSPPLGQSLVVLVSYSVSIALVIILSLISVNCAIFFMLIMGGVSIMASNKWLNFLYMKFYSMKYEKMEKFREQ